MDFVRILTIREEGRRVQGAFESTTLMEIHGTVRDILQNKGGEVWTTAPQHTVYEALRLMGEINIGALVVVEGSVCA